MADGNTRLYTRAGNFKVDPNGNVLNQDGLRVLGFPANGAGGLEALNINNRTAADVSTTQVDITGNLDATVPISVPPATVTFANLNNDAAFSTFVDVFDSLGGEHTITTYFFRTGNNTWTVQAYVDGGEVNAVGAAAGVPFLIGQNVGMTFGADGGRAAPPPPDDILAQNGGANPFQWSNGAADPNIAINFDPFTQFSSPSTIASIFQNGTGSGSPIGFNVEIDGTLFAQLDNGQRAVVGTVALVAFANAEGLQRLGGSLYSDTSSSGEPVVGTPNVGQFGAIQPGALELSTADIAADFIKLISLQRAFQGSSRLVTNVDDLLNEIINLA